MRAGRSRITIVRVRLISVDLDGFRRFARHQTLETDGALTAIVGPNEAGKTSVLDALTKLDNPAPFELRDLHGRVALPSDHNVVTALYALEDQDRAAIAHLHSGQAPERARLFEVRLKAGGALETHLHSGLTRDQGPRQQAHKTVADLQRAKWLRVLLAEADEAVIPASTEGEEPDDDEQGLQHAPLRPPALVELSQGLESEAETLDYTTVAALAETAAALRAIGGERAERAAAKIEAAHTTEIALHPNEDAKLLLFARRPRFLKFNERERDLRSEYDLLLYEELAPFAPDQYAPEEREPLPAPLVHLARLAQLDLRELTRLITEDNSALRLTRLDAANQRLADIFASWSQGHVTIRLDLIDRYTLRLHVSDPAGGWTQLGERSDGLKMFVSLVALTRAEADPPPVILVDEIERHLHYDAQADLIQVFTQQTSIPQIIYTTHSAGCLPEDLGDGVRLVEPVENEHASEIINRFWSKGSGFGPLLVGLGASTLAFVPVRYAVLCEGGTEVVLLPRLLREATDQRALGYQVAPASSEAPAAHIAGLDLQALGVAWVVDGDDGGNELRGRLIARGIPERNIRTLGGARSGLVLEDCVDLDVYVGAVNAELERSGRSPRLGVNDLPQMNRPKALERWCESHRIPCPNKVDVANRVLDAKKNNRLVASNRTRVLQKLDAELRAFFEARK